MTDVTKLVVVSVVITLLLVFLVNFFYQGRDAAGSASPGIAAIVATSSTIAVGEPNVGSVDLFVANKLCSARIITTVSSPILLSFFTTASTTLSANVGHLQAASTTVSYSAGEYGCGLLSAVSAISTTTITKTETE